MNFSYSIKEKEKYFLVKLSGNLMEKNQANELMEEITHDLTKNSKLFILDMKDMEYLNSSGLTVFLNILTKSRKAGGDTVLCHVSNKVKNVFAITRLTEVFTIIDNEESAIAEKNIF